MVAFNFNAQQFEPSYGSTHKQLKPGKMMKGIIVDSRGEPTKDGKGQMMVFDVQCIEGPQQGGIQTDRLNLHNVSAQAVEIANKQLSAYCHAIGVYTVTDTAQLHNRPFCFDVDWQKGHEPTQEKPEGGYTHITALYDINGNAPGKAGSGPRVNAAPPPAQPPAQVAPLSPPPPNGGGWQQNNGGANANAGWGNR